MTDEKKRNAPRPPPTAAVSGLLDSHTNEQIAALLYAYEHAALDAYTRAMQRWPVPLRNAMESVSDAMADALFMILQTTVKVGIPNTPTVTYSLLASAITKLEARLHEQWCKDGSAYAAPTISTLEITASGGAPTASDFPPTRERNVAFHRVMFGVALGVMRDLCDTGAKEDAEKKIERDPLETASDEQKAKAGLEINALLAALRGNPSNPKA